MLNSPALPSTRVKGLGKELILFVMSISKEAKVIGLVIVGICTAYFGVRYLQGKSLFTSQKTYYVAYDSCLGLHATDPVLVKGYRVGTVQAVQLMPENDFGVRVTLSIDRDIPVYQNTVAQLADRGVGRKAINFVYAKHAADMLPPDSSMQACIAPSIVDAVSQSIVPILENTQRSSELLLGLMQDIVGSKRHLNTVFANLENASRNLDELVQANTRGLTTFAKDMGDVSAAISHSQTGLKPLLAGMNRVMGTLEGAQLKTSLAKLRTMIDTLEAMLVDKDSKSSFALLLRDEKLYKNVNRSVNDVGRLMRHIKRSPRKLIHFSIFGR